MSVQPSPPRRRLLCGLAMLGLGLAAPVSGADAAQRHKVVYHLDDSARATAAIRSIGNHLKATPSVSIVVVALGPGIDFLLKGAKDDRGNPYEPMIDDLAIAGVQFRACNNTLAARQIDRSRLHPEIKVVESGVAELTRLQLEEHYAYLKP